jgi:cell division control protein 7
MVSMAAAFLSQHSSNPLEVSSSDIRNKKLLQQYMRAQAARGDDSMVSSDDPLAVQGEIEAYGTQRHTKVHGAGRRDAVVDLDEDMESDDELIRGDEEEEDETMVVEQEGGEEEEEGQEELNSDDEEHTLLLKSREERDEIEEEIADLESAVPLLTADYKIIDRLGTGTFSSVYKAIDLGYHTRWDNIPWHGHHPSSSSAYYQTVRKPEGCQVYVAVKRIYVTSNPERIRNEIAIMEDCRGCRHVSQLITAFRHADQVVAIMPYHRNDDFRVCPSLLLSFSSFKIPDASDYI